VITLEGLQGRQNIHGAPWGHSLLRLARGGEQRGGDMSSQDYFEVVTFVEEC